ncbi:MAG: RDD family protein [Gemmatimonadales bacterium]
MEQRVGFGKRLGAFLLDCVIVWGLAWLLGGTIGGLIGGRLGTMAAPGMTEADPATAAMAAGMMGAIMGTIAAMALIGTVYFLVEGFTGYTLGKLLLGIRVASADGRQAPISQLLTRFALKNINFLCTMLALLTGVALLRTIGGLMGLAIFVGCFFVLGASRQALHDMIAKTAVYPKDKIAAA